MPLGPKISVKTLHWYLHYNNSLAFLIILWSIFLTSALNRFLSQVSGITSWVVWESSQSSSMWVSVILYNSAAYHMLVIYSKSSLWKVYHIEGFKKTPGCIIGIVFKRLRWPRFFVLTCLNSHYSKKKSIYVTISVLEFFFHHLYGSLHPCLSYSKSPADLF